MTSNKFDESVGMKYSFYSSINVGKKYWYLSVTVNWSFVCLFEHFLDKQNIVLFWSAWLASLLLIRISEHKAFQIQILHNSN